MMDLFSTEIDHSINLLPKDGIVNYFGKVLSEKEANHYFDRLMHTIEWKNDQAVLFGNVITTKRKVAWYGDTDFEYTYSNTTKRAFALDDPLQNWFDFPIPDTSIPGDYIEKALEEDLSKTPKSGTRVVWLGGAPIISIMKKSNLQDSSKWPRSPSWKSEIPLY